ncbi:MAG TPA: 1,4-alpha-glucan branching protein GlgB [Terriglobia bacterium]|nr:1,4-alpha-glucan branching protein GlgB [Terriglobia bacterium]
MSEHRQREAEALSLAEIISLSEGSHGNPFAILGIHAEGEHRVLRAFLPGALAVTALDDAGNTAELHDREGMGLFTGRWKGAGGYRLRIDWPAAIQETEDPYGFGTLIGEQELHAFAQGRHFRLGDMLGAHYDVVDGVAGVRFAVWAPNAQRVSVVGDFNSWDGRRHVMRLRHTAGVWELFIPRLVPGALYKYEIRDRAGHVLPLRADPVAFYAEEPPATASVVADIAAFTWQDDTWLRQRSERHRDDRPLSIYEVHAASWMRKDGQLLSWQELAERLIPYVTAMGFTHVEFLPVMEHPFAGSWGYQPLSLYAPTARHGHYADFAALVDAFHQAGIGVLLDWVPGHFPNDAHGLGLFDGTHLYEHQDPREGFHRDWNTLIYNFGRNEVRAFLISSALHWLRVYHIDGLRVDAVASMLYRDYSRREGEWIPNVHGGRENLEAISLLQALNTEVRTEFPDALMIAEESTAWPHVTRPPQEGLGFTHKWNMGWMNDTLRYIGLDPVYRSYHHHDMTFSFLYGFTEKFILPLSHDEVVHGKRSILRRIPGDDWQAFATLRAYLAFMWCHPGKKLVFMGTELAPYDEWNHDGELPWQLLDSPRHRQTQLLLRELNRLYRDLPALHERDFNAGGFGWLEAENREQSIFAFRRIAEDGRSIVVVSNFTPLPRPDHRIGLPEQAAWRTVLNTDAARFGGAGILQDSPVIARETAWQGQPCSAVLTIPPLATVILAPA